MAWRHKEPGSHGIGIVFWWTFLVLAQEMLMGIYFNAIYEYSTILWYINVMP